MTETKPIYQEASKETVENLIGNFSKTIEDLHKKVVEDLSVLKELNADVPQLLRLAIELRMNMRFILIDLMTSLRGCLKGTYTFEKCYHIKNLEGIRVEGCRLLFGYGEGSEESIWMKLECELKQVCQRFEKTKYAQVYERLLALYDKVSTQLRTVMTTYEERKSRNLTYHYDDDLYKVYKQLVKVKDKGEDEPMKCVIPWMDALLWIQVLCDTIEYVETWQGNTFSKVTGFHHFRINVIKLDFYKRTVTEFSKNDQFKEILDKVLKDIDSVDWAAKKKDKLGRLEDWLGKNAPNQDKPKTIKDIKDLMNVYLLIEMSFADMACVIRAFMNAGSDIEYPLTFRRLLVSKVSTLGHLVGYNDTEKGNALWSFIQKAVPVDAEKLKTEAAEIRMELESLLKQEDVKRRALYVHYLDRGTNESNVLRILESIERIDLLIEMNAYPAFIKIMGRIRKFLKNLMAALAIRVDKTTKASNIKMRAQIQGLRQLLNNPKCPADLRISFNKTLDQMGKIFNLYA
jgi:hypothetical protein